MKEKLVSLLVLLHGKTPLWLGAVYMPFVYFLRHLQTFYLKSYLIDGEERESGEPIRIAYFGRDLRIRRYWTGAILRENSSLQKGKTTALQKIRSFARSNQNNHDLAIVEMTRLTRFFFRPRQGFILPRWFDTLLDVDFSLEAIGNNDTKKHIRKHRFSCEVRTAEEDLQFFYDRMFKPYIQARHKDASVMVEYSYFLKRFRKKDSRMYFLMMDDQPVVASFNERKEGEIKFSGIGVLDGSREVVRKGAIRALYFFMLSDYKKEGIKQIGFGGTSPLLSDGLTQFKISMRASPNQKNLLGEKSLWFLPLADTKSLRILLKANPFLHILEKKVYRAIFVDPDELNGPFDLKKILKRTHYRRIAGTKIYSLNSTDQLAEWIHELDLEDHQAEPFRIEIP